MPATVSAQTRAAYPTLTAHVEFTAGLRASKHYARRLAHYPATLVEFVDFAYGTAPRAKDKVRGRAACLREIAALAADPVAAADLVAVYRGE